MEAEGLTLLGPPQLGPKHCPRTGPSAWCWKLLLPSSPHHVRDRFRTFQKKYQMSTNKQSRHVHPERQGWSPGLVVKLRRNRPGLKETIHGLYIMVVSWWVRGVDSSPETHTRASGTRRRFSSHKFSDGGYPFVTAETRSPSSLPTNPHGWPLSPSRLCFHSSEPVISVSRSLRVGHGGTKTYLISGRAYCPNTVTILGKRKAWFLPRKRVRVKVQLKKKKEKKQTSHPNDGKPDSGVKNLLRET